MQREIIRLNSELKSSNALIKMIKELPNVDKEVLGLLGEK